MVSGGIYEVKESGLEFQPLSQEPDIPVSADEFLENFRNTFEMRILERPTPNELVFELIHVDTSFVNALRRILLAEVPTVAIEHVYMWNNSSIIHDEVLAHRLGLVPLNVDARMLDERTSISSSGGDQQQQQHNRDDEASDEDDSPTDRNTVVFRLAVSCPKAPNNNGGAAASHAEDDADTWMLPGSSDDVDELAATADQVATAGRRRPLAYPSDRPFTKHVYSSDLVWIPQGDQEERFCPTRLGPIHQDILLAKLRPGQAIELEAHARKGVGKDHAKYSPVATASYRLMPVIELLQPVYDDLAEELVHVYEPGVFALVPTDATDPVGTRQKAVLVNPYACTMSRNYMRHAVLAKSIRMSRIADHFIFSVESVGTYSPAVLVAEALRSLQRKCEQLIFHIEESQAKSES